MNIILDAMNRFALNHSQIDRSPFVYVTKYVSTAVLFFSKCLPGLQLTVWNTALQQNPVLWHASGDLLSLTC